MSGGRLTKLLAYMCLAVWFPLSKTLFLRSGIN